MDFTLLQPFFDQKKKSCYVVERWFSHKYHSEERSDEESLPTLAMGSLQINLDLYNNRRLLRRPSAAARNNMMVGSAIINFEIHHKGNGAWAMPKKKYSINWENDEAQSFEVNGVTYESLDDVPDWKDRDKLSA